MLSPIKKLNRQVENTVTIKLHCPFSLVFCPETPQKGDGETYIIYIILPESRSVLCSK
jgi:hypothetical protein